MSSTSTSTGTGNSVVDNTVNNILKQFQTDYDFPETVVDYLRDLMTKEIGITVDLISKNNSSSTVIKKVEIGKKPRNMSAYNMYIRTRFKAYNGEKNKSQQNMTDYASDWKKLSEEEKEEYQTQADEVNNVKREEKTKKKKTRKPVGYNLWYKANVGRIKASLEEGEGTMKKCGSEWRSLPQTERDVWNEKAKREAESD